MQVIKELDQKHIKGPVAVGLGNFDGLHTGHMELIKILLDRSNLMGLDTMLYTFINHPKSVVDFAEMPRLITDVDDKIELIEKTGIDHLCLSKFDHKFSRMEPEEFVKDILVGILKIKLVVIGFNYRFGFKGGGDVDLLEKLGRKYGFEVQVIPPVKVENEIVSSTLIRKYLSEGDMYKTSKMLGRYHFVSGRVINGFKQGRIMGIPTANMVPSEYVVIPPNGAYVTRTSIGDRFFESVTNIGFSPTFNRSQKLIETHLIDFGDDLYDRALRVHFVYKIREEQKFKDTDTLVSMINLDIDFARKYFKIS